MRIGIMCGAPGGAVPPGSTLDETIAFAKQVESQGFDTLWMAQIFGLDAIATLGLVGRETSRIELGTAVVPTYPRHPVVMAGEALTASAASGGRFSLGVGLSHKVVIEGQFGYSFERPARHMREYLEALVPLLAGDVAKPKSHHYNFAAQLQVPDARPVPVLVAALGEAMLRVTGRLADGTITWMTGPRTLETHIGKIMRAAASDAGRPAPRVVAGLPVVVSNQPEVDRERVAKILDIYGQLPSYRSMLDIEGFNNPGDAALIGDEKELRTQLQQVRDAGVTDLDAAVVPLEDDTIERTLTFLSGERG